MSNISDFNRVDNCDKIDADCIDAYFDYKLDPENPTGLCIHTPWGGDCLDLISIVKAGETVTTMYLSPEGDPNCLVFEREDGEKDCIHGDDLSRIISMKYLKDVDQTIRPTDGDVYMYDSTTNLFEPFNLKNYINETNIALQNINAQINRILAILTPPADAPADVTLCWGNINDYSDPAVVINEGSGSVTTLNKNHGLYTHLLSQNRYGDEIFG